MQQAAPGPIPKKLKEPTGQAAVDLLQLCAHALIIFPEATERFVEAMEGVADAADTINLFYQRKGIAEGFFTKEEFLPEEVKDEAAELRADPA